MEHLSGLDASFLHLETPEMPMHVGGLHLLDLPQEQHAGFADILKRHIADRMHLAAVFSKKLAPMPFDIANPVWIDDDDVDLDYHIRQIALPRPGTRTQLEAYVGRLHSSLLDRSRPLWEFYLLTGLDSGQLGFYTKIHHAALDGQGAMVLAQALLDLTPVPREVEAPPAHERAPYQPAVATLLKAALRDTVSQTLHLARGIPTGVRVAVSVLTPSRDPDKTGLLARFSPAPRTPLNVSITNQRAFATATISVKEALEVGKAFGATLNDVVLAIVSGALRRYLDEHGALPAKSLVAAVPVSLREDGDQKLNNQVSMMLVKLASEEDDLAVRVKAIVKASGRMKQTAANLKSVLPTEFPSLGLPWLMSALVALYGRARLADTLPPVANVVVSNVPGPRTALYLAGARVATNYPVSIVTHGLALNVTVQSYNGALDFGIIACRRAVPDVHVFATCMTAAHEELLAAAWKMLAQPVRKRAAVKKAPVLLKETVASKAPAKRKAPTKPKAPGARAS